MPYVLSRVSERYKISYELKRMDLPPLPSGATNYQYESGHGLFTGDLYVVFQCSPSEGEKYIHEIQQAKPHRIDATYVRSVESDQPAWYRPGRARRGWYIYEVPWGPDDEPLGYQLNVTYDEDSQTMYVYWFWS